MILKGIVLYDFLALRTDPLKKLLRFDACPGSIITPLSNGTFLAEGFSCHTGSSTMPDEKARKMGPLPLRNDLDQVEFNLHRVLIFCQTDPLAQSLDMGIDNDSRDSKGIPQDDIGRLSANSGEGHQLL